MNSGLSAYRKVGATSGVQDADPHRLIQMLFRGLMDSLHAAEGQLRNGDQVGKVASIDRASRIIDALRSSLDFKGGELAENLDALYEYASRRLVESNAANDVDGIQEVERLLAPIQAAWDEIRPAVNAGGSGPAQGSGGPRPGVHV